MAFARFTVKHRIITHNTIDWYVTSPLPGDRNCFFYSISYLLYNSNISRHCAEYVKKNPEVFQSYVPANDGVGLLINEIAQSHAWGGQYDAVAVAYAYNMCVSEYLLSIPLKVRLLFPMTIYAEVVKK